MPEILAFDALELFGTTMDQGKSCNRNFSELTDDEKAEFIRFIKNTNPLCGILTSKELVTFGRQLLNMCYQSFQKRRCIATVSARVSMSNPNFSVRTFSDARTIVASKLHKLLEVVRASTENKVQMSLCLATPWSLNSTRKTFILGGKRVQTLEYLNILDTMSYAIKFPRNQSLCNRSQRGLFTISS